MAQEGREQDNGFGDLNELAQSGEAQRKVEKLRTSGAANFKVTVQPYNCTILYWFVIFCLVILRKLRLSISTEVKKMKITLLAATMFFITKETCPNLDKSYNEKIVF